MNITYEDWGRIDFDVAFEKQKQLVSAIQKGERPETIVFCQHNPVVTVGRKTLPGDIFGWSGKTVEVNRGGRATYHGPNQVVVYPLLNLNGGVSKKFPPKDIHQYLRFLENFILDFLAQYCVDGETHPVMASPDNHEENATGVWVNQKKIASIGIAIQKWVTSHGISINLIEDKAAFQGIKPCGFHIEQITNLERLIKKRVDYESAVTVLQKLLVSYGFKQS